jgi:hypothetical protein
LKQGVPIEQVGDFIDDDPNTGDWFSSTNDLINKPVPKTHVVDGSGLPEVCSSNTVGPRYSGVVGNVAQIIFNKVDSWCDSPDVEKFLSTFESSTRVEQSELAGVWSHLGVQILADDCREATLQLLEEHGFGEKETLDVPSSEVCPLRIRLLEVLCRICEDENVPNDTSMLLGVTGGCGVGLKVPIHENPACWPLARGSRPLRKGEPLDIRWNKTGCEFCHIPSCGKIEEGLMKTLVYKQIEDELVAGRMVEANWDNSTTKALTKLSAIWKSDRLKVRLLSDFRRSGINRQIPLLTTVLLPKLSDIKVLLMESSSSEFLGEFDIKSAYRNIPVSPHEADWLCVTDPRESNSPGKCLRDVCLPFGLISSPLIFCRINANLFRLQKKLFRVIFKSEPKAMLYIDDASWFLKLIKQLVFVIVISLMLKMPIEFTKVHYQKSNTRIQGVRVCIETRSISIPEEKRSTLTKLIMEVLNCNKILVATLESLTGKLSWCAQLIRHWKPNLQYLYQLKGVATTEKLRSIQLSEKVKEVLRTYVQQLSCDISIPVMSITAKQIHLITDASTYGLGGCYSFEEHFYWFALNQDDDVEIWSKIIEMRNTDNSLVCGDISYLELFAIIEGLLCIEKFVANKCEEFTIHCMCDNVAAVTAINKWNSTSKSMRWLLGMVTGWVGRVTATHIAGEENIFCDFVSRNPKAETRGRLQGVETWSEVEPIDPVEFSIK